ELTAGAVEAAQAAPAADRAGTFEERMRNGLLEAGIVYAAVPGAAAQPAPAVQPAPAAGATQAPAAASTQQGGGAAQEIRELRSVYADSINKQHDFYTHHKISDEQFTALLAQSQGQPDIRGYYIAMLNAGNPGFRPGTTLLHYLGDGQILAT